MGSSQTKDRTCVLCIARQILNHWTTREALGLFLTTIQKSHEESRCCWMPLLPHPPQSSFQNRRYSNCIKHEKINSAYNELEQEHHTPASLFQLPWLSGPPDPHRSSRPQRQSLRVLFCNDAKPSRKKLSATWRSSFHGEGKRFHGSSLCVEVRSSPGLCTVLPLDPHLLCSEYWPQATLIYGWISFLSSFPQDDRQASWAWSCSQGQATMSGGRQMLEKVQGSGWQWLKGWKPRQMLGWGAQHDPRCLVGRPCDAGDSIQLLPLSPEGPNGETPDLCWEAGRIQTNSPYHWEAECKTGSSERAQKHSA